MKDSRIRERFEEIASDMGQRPEAGALYGHLKTIHDAVQDMRDEGLALTLALRPGGYKFTQEFDSEMKPLANGTINVEGVDLDFSVTRSQHGAMRFKAYVGQDNVASLFLDESANLRKAVVDAVIRVAVQLKKVEEFNINEKGFAGVAIDKSIAVPHSLRLKNSPKP